MQLRLTGLFLLVAILAQAQEMYTFTSDRMFKDPADLVGYNFVPSEMEVPDEYKENLEPGEYSFGVSQNNLYVKGEGIDGVYSMNNINPTEYGYKLNLMNARDPRIQGHLKVILNRYFQVDALVFKRSKQDKEIIFFNGLLTKEEDEEKRDFYTDRWETKVIYRDSVWGKTLRPMFRIHSGDNTQEKLEKEDETTIRFFEEVTVIDKNKKKKDKSSSFDLDNIEAGTEEEATEEEETEEKKKKIKVVRKYYVEINSMMHYGDGSVEDKTWTYEVKEIKEREDRQAGPDGERFQLVFDTNHEDLYLYLTNDRTISSFEMQGYRYLMQGH